MSITRTITTKLSEFATAMAQIWEGYKQTPTACCGMDPVSWEQDAWARYRATQQADAAKQDSTP